MRFALVVPFVILFLNEKYLESAICIGLSGISDCLDGFFARKLNQVTQLGKLLDPIADKITLISVMTRFPASSPISLQHLNTLPASSRWGNSCRPPTPLTESVFPSHGLF